MLSATLSSSCLRSVLPLLHIVLLLLLAPFLLRSQPNAPSRDDLAYDQTTIAALHRIVDSLHAAFAALPPDSPMVAPAQAIGSFIGLRGDSATIADVAREIAGGASFEHIATRYGELIDCMRREVVIIRRNGEKEGETRPATYAALLEWPNIFYTGEERFVDTSDDASRTASRWLWHAGWGSRETEDGEMVESMRLEAILMPPGESRPIIPERYARMIRYAGFMVDSTTKLTTKEREKDTSGESYEECTQRLNDMVDFPARPRGSDGSPIGRDDPRYQQWVEACDARRALMARDPLFVEAVVATAEAAIREHVNDPEIYETVESCMPNDRGLALVRRMSPRGICTTPNGPDFLQVISIARLAALARRWPLFINAHLNLLARSWPLSYDPHRQNNSRTDELSAIGMDLPSLLIGAWMRRSPVASGRTWPDGEGIVAAAAEPHGREELERRLLEAMEDRSLDDRTRWMSYTLYLASTLRLAPDLRRACLIDLQSCGDALPGYIREHLAEIMEQAR